MLAFTTMRFRRCTPFPHVTGQKDHGLHGDTWQSFAGMPHRCVLHISVWDKLLGLHPPPWNGRARIRRFRLRWPPPQVEEQAPHCSQFPIKQATGGSGRITQPSVSCDDPVQGLRTNKEPPAMFWARLTSRTRWRWPKVSFVWLLGDSNVTHPDHVLQGAIAQSAAPGHAKVSHFSLSSWFPSQVFPNLVAWAKMCRVRLLTPPLQVALQTDHMDQGAKVQFSGLYVLHVRLSLSAPLQAAPPFLDGEIIKRVLVDWPVDDLHFVQELHSDILQSQGWR